MTNLALALEPTFLLDVKSKEAKHWIVIGCGGNGGYFIPQLARAISIQNRLLTIERRPLHQLTLIDADIVEDKNLTRQNFLPIDVKHNKAKVMANRYGRAFGLEIRVLEGYMESEEMLKKEIKSSGLKPVVVGCVDNNKTRALVHNVFKQTKGMFYLDAGNEEWAGQVVLGYNAGGAKPQKGEAKPHLFDIPSVADIFPEILEATDKLPTELSCAERAVSNPQNIFTNMTAANLMMGFANTILTANAADGRGLKQHCVIFNSETLSQTTTFNKWRYLVTEEEVKAEVAEKVDVAKKVEVEAK